MWKLLNLVGIKHPKSGNLLTVHDAIKFKIFDVDKATLVVNIKQDPLSLDEALKRNVIDSKLHDSLRSLSDLSKKYEIKLDDKEDLDDIDGSAKRVKVIEFNQNGAKSVAEAIEEGSVDSTSGLFRLKDGSFITITDAYNYGYLIKNETVKIKSTPMSFSDALAQGLFNEQGFMVDRNSGAKHQLLSALANNLILDNLREIVDIKNDEKLTVRRALDIGLLDSKNGMFKNSLSNESCTFNLAHNSHLISKPLTLKDLVDLELMKENNKILSPTYSKWLSIEEAIKAGVLDLDNYKCITREKGTLLTLSEAIQCGVISLDGFYKDLATDEILSLKQAADRGLISSVAQRSIFDIDGFKNPQDDTFVSFNVALKNHILRRGDKSFVLVTADNRLLTLDEGLELGLVRPEVFSMLMRHIGVFNKDKNELRVIDLVFYKLIDPNSGYLLGPESGAQIPLNDAIELQLITASGALLLSSLLSITLTTETITKTIKRYVTIREKDSLRPKSLQSYSDVVQRGLVSIGEQTYHEPNEERYYLVQDALNNKLVLADTEVMNGTPRRGTLTIVTKSFSPVNDHSSTPSPSTSSSTSYKQKSEQKSTIKILKKMQKKIIKLSDALHMGLINEETHELLENNVAFVNNPDSFLKNKKYKVIDPQSGASLLIEEAIEREILNPNDITKFYIPFCKSLTIPQLIERDLLDVESQLIVHPETGDLLTLNEAIACDIVDKYSLIKKDKKHKMSLRDALKSDYLDGHLSIVKTKKGDLSLKAAVERGLFEAEKPTEKTNKQTEIPLIGQTFPVVVKRNLFNPTKREVINKTSGKSIPIKDAIESDYIMSVPCTPNADEIYIIDALNQQLIDFKNQTYRNPHTGEVMLLFDAYNKGFLIAKPLHAIISHESLKSTEVTNEVKNVSHTVKTKSIDILDGYTMVSANEILNNRTGETITLDEAKDQGIAIERVEVNQFSTSQVGNDSIQEILKPSPEPQKNINIGNISQVTVMVDPNELQPAEVSESQTTSTSTHVTIKKITTFKEIMIDENGKEISQSVSETPETFERISESTLPADDADFQEIIAKFKEENPDFDSIDQEGVITTTTINDETIVTRTVKEYNIVKSETETFTSTWNQEDVIDEGVEAHEFQEGHERVLIENLPSDVSNETNSRTVTTITKTTKHFTTSEDQPEEPQIISEISINNEPNVSETTTVEELPGGERKTIVITTTRVISTKDSEGEPSEIPQTETQYEVVTNEPTIDDESTVQGRTKTIITSTIRSVTEKFSEDDQQIFEPHQEKLKEVEDDKLLQSNEIIATKPTKKTKNVFDLTSQFLDNERDQKTPVPAPRSKKASKTEVKVSKEEKLPSEPVNESTEQTTKTIVVTTITQDVPVESSQPDIIDERDNDEAARLKHLESIVDTTLLEKGEQRSVEIISSAKSGETLTTTTTIITTTINEPTEIEVVSKPDTVEQIKLEIPQEVESVITSTTVATREPSPRERSETKTPEEASVNSVKEAPETSETKIPKAAPVTSVKVAPDTSPERSETKIPEEAPVSPVKEAPDTPPERSETKIPEEAAVSPVKEAPADTAKSGMSKIITDFITNESSTPAVGNVSITRTTITPPVNVETVTPEAKVISAPREPSPTEIESVTTTTSSVTREPSPPDSVKSQTTEMLKVKQFTVAENIIEVTPLRDAIKKGKIEPKICRIMDNGNELPLTVHDALIAKELSPTDIVQIISSHVVVLMRDTPKAYLLNLQDNFSEGKLREIGLYDKNVPCFVDPWTGNQISFKYFIFNLDVLDPSIFVKNQQLEVYVPIQQAFDEDLIDPQLGTVVDTKTKKQIPIFEAVERKLVIQRTPQDLRIIKRPSTVVDLLRNGNISFESDEVIINNENLTLVEALRKGALDTNTISIRDPASGDIFGYRYAADRGIVDIRRGVIINQITLEEILFIIAYRRGFLLIGKIQPISLNAALNSGLYDKKNNKIKNPTTDEYLSIENAISVGLIDPKLTDVKDTKNNKFVVLKDAIEFNLVDPKANMIKNKKSSIPLDKALKEKLIFNKTEPFDLAEIITRNYYDPETGKMLNPYTNKYITIREAIVLKIININYIRIYDVVQDRVFSVEEAIANGLLDDQKGIITRPKMTLDKAFLQRILISFNGPLSLPSALNCNLFDPDTRKFSFDDKNLNLGEAIEHNKIAGNELVLYDPNRQKLSTLNDAISAGYLDPIESKIVDPITNKEIPIDDAMEQGLLVKSRSDVSLKDAVFDGLYDPESGSFSNVTSDEKLPLETAINRNIIDVRSTVVSVNNVTLDFEQAIEQGLVDPQNAIVKTKSGDSLNLIEAFDRGILNTISKPVRLHEAVIKNLYDESVGLFTDPESRRKITIQESIQESLIDPNSIQIQDPGSKSYLPISINFAIQTGLINAKDGHVNYDNKTYSLKDAFDLGILIDSKGPVSIQRTIHQGTFNEKLGRIADPFSDKNITVHEAMRKFVVNPHLPCYFDEEKEKLLSLNEACKHKLIDRYQGDFTIPYSGQKLTLNDAMKLGWIIDIESGNFSLYKLLLLRLVNYQNGKLVHPVTSRQLTLNQAIAQELVDPNSSLVKHRNGKYFNLNEAMRFGVIDGEKNLYWISESQAIPLYEAMLKGLIVSNERPFALMNAIEMRFYRPETGKFVDPFTNTYVDLKSAIDGNLIQENSTQFKNLLTKQTKPLSQAIADGDINTAKGRVFDQKSGSSFNYDVAFDRGLLINLPRGLAVQKKEVKEIVHQEIPQIKIDLVDSSKPREMRLEDVIKAGILKPESAFIKDPETGKYILLHVYIEKYQINLSQKAFIDPKSSFFVFSPQCVIYTREPKSFDDVIESKQLNLVTGKLVDPQNVDKYCTIQEAIEAGVLDPDTILIKDGAQKKLVPVTEALKTGLIDPERSHVVDTETSKLLSLEKALQEGILKTPKKQFDLLEALQFNLYDPTSGHFTDPFMSTLKDPKVKAKITFEEALAKNFIDTSTTMVRTSKDSEIIPISTAITTGIIDPVSGKMNIRNPENDQTESIDFVKARELDLLVPAGERVR